VASRDVETKCVLLTPEPVFIVAAVHVAVVHVAAAIQKNILKWVRKFFAFAGFLSGCGATIAEEERQGNDLKKSYFL